MRNVLWVVGTFLLSILHASAEADSTITLNAVKYYKPSRHEDGVYNTSSLVEAIIPRDIAVISGNAGNSLAVLNFDRSRCIYTGGSSKPNPLSGKSNSTDIAAGSKYSLKMCIPSLVELLERLSRRKSLIPKEGDSFNVKKSIVLHVVNGDSSLPTKAQVEIVLRGEPVLPKLLAITAPEGGTGSSNDISYVIQGIIATSAVSPKIVIGRVAKTYPSEVDVAIPINSDRTFSSRVNLFSGANQFNIQLYQNDVLKETSVINLAMTPEGDVVAAVDPAVGARLIVTDSSLSTYGTEWIVPAGAAKRNFYASIHNDIGHRIALPQDVVQVGAGATFFPISEKFNSNSIFKLPIQENLLPESATTQDVEILALDSNRASGRDFWKSIPVSERGLSSVSHIAAEVAFYAIVPVVRKQARAGVVQIFSNAHGATVYFDSVKVKGGLPAIVSGVSTGVHQIQVFAPGYNEHRKTVTVGAEGLNTSIELIPSSGILPIVTITTPLTGEITVNQNIATLQGTVTTYGANGSDGFLVISQNGFDSLAQIQSNGVFSHVVPLSRGTNEISFRYTSVAGATGISRTIRILNNPVIFESISSSPSARSSQLVQIIPHPFPLSTSDQSTRSAKLFDEERASPAQFPSSQRLRTSTSQSVTGLEDAAGKNVQIILSWNTPNTDIDLHIPGGHPKSLTCGHLKIPHPAA